MGKIIDVFPYYNEKELLELRIRMLENYVDEFIISEANKTHSGIDKDFELEQTIEELNLPKEKIRILKVDLSDEKINEPIDLDFMNAYRSKSQDQVLNWTRERIQRDALCDILNEYSYEDAFIISDCDEIIKPDAIQSIVEKLLVMKDVIFRIPLILLELRADLRVYDDTLNEPTWWHESMFVCMRHHLEACRITAIKSNVGNPWNFVYLTHDDIVLTELGWHFTWMGGSERNIKKSNATIHSSNLNMMNNMSKELEEILSRDLSKKIETPWKYSLKKMDHSLLPKEVFELKRVREFLFQN